MTILRTYKKQSCKKSHIGSEVSEILRYLQTDTHTHTDIKEKNAKLMGIRFILHQQLLHFISLFILPNDQKSLQDFFIVTVNFLMRP